MNEIGYWVNKLTENYVEGWLSEQIAAAWQEDRDKLAERDTQLAALRGEKRAAEAEAGKQICRNTELEAELAGLREAAREFFNKEMGVAAEAYAAKYRLRRMVLQETAEQERFRILAMTHKKPTQAAEEWLADRKKMAELRDAAQELLDHQGHCTYWGRSDAPHKAKQKLAALLQESSSDDEA